MNCLQCEWLDKKMKTCNMYKNPKESCPNYDLDKISSEPFHSNQNSVYSGKSCLQCEWLDKKIKTCNMYKNPKESCPNYDLDTISSVQIYGGSSSSYSANAHNTNISSASKFKVVETRTETTSYMEEYHSNTGTMEDNIEKMGKEISDEIESHPGVYAGIAMGLAGTAMFGPIGGMIGMKLGNSLFGKKK